MESVGTHFKDANRLPEYWKAACAVWVETVMHFCANFAYSDAPWEYLERSNSAILAGALTAGGAPAMPEMYVMRHGATTQGEQRVDMCLVTGNSNVTMLELVECKLAEYNAATPVTMGRIQTHLQRAHDQVKNITGLHGKAIIDLPSRYVVKYTGVVIGLPCFQPRTTSFDMESAVDEIIQDLQRAPVLDAVAWCFPMAYRGVPSRRYGGKFYPGIFLAVQAAYLGTAQ